MGEPRPRLSAGARSWPEKERPLGLSAGNRRGQGDREDAGFWDASLWEEAKKKGQEAIKKLIDAGLVNTSVTAVLIGPETASREWVLYEIKESYSRHNGLLGIYIHSIKDQWQRTEPKGSNPFDNVWLPRPNGPNLYFSALYPTYDWVADKGYNNLGSWVETSAKAAGR